LETTVYVIETSDDLYSRPYEFYCVCAKKEDADARALGLNGVKYDDLIMRANNDSRMDFEVKRDQLNLIRSMYGPPLLWYDDNQDVTSMLKEEGVLVIQISPSGLPFLR
jgi:hypothetical protein